MHTEPQMSDRKPPLIPNFKKELIALFQRFGPGWMLAALIVVTVPLWWIGLAAVIHAIADLVRATHA